LGRAGTGIPYRVVGVAAGELGLSAAKNDDTERRFPGQQHFREIISMSNTTDLQARLLGIRYRLDQGGRQEVHALDGTAVTARSPVAIVESFQDEEGSAAVPPVLERSGAPSRVVAAC
jgi:seryl-tRNA synthetase